MADNNFKGTVEALFHGMDGVVSSKTVVGDAIHIGDTIILPLVDVSFAVGAGAFNEAKKENNELDSVEESKPDVNTKKTEKAVDEKPKVKKQTQKKKSKKE